MTTGERIKMLRERAGMSQSELGAKVGVQKSAIHKYETGDIINLKRSTIAKLAEALNASPAYLLCVDEKEKLAPVSESELSKVDAKIMEGVQGLSEQQKKLILAQVEAWLLVE